MRESKFWRRTRLFALTFICPFLPSFRSGYTMRVNKRQFNGCETEGHDRVGAAWAGNLGFRLIPLPDTLTAFAALRARWVGGNDWVPRVGLADSANPGLSASTPLVSSVWRAARGEGDGAEFPVKRPSLSVAPQFNSSTGVKLRVMTGWGRRACAVGAGFSGATWGVIAAVVGRSSARCCAGGEFGFSIDSMGRYAHCVRRAAREMGGWKRLGTPG